MFDLHLPLLGLFGAGFVLDLLWRGFCDWLQRFRAMSRASAGDDVGRQPRGRARGPSHTGPCRGLDYASADA
jgi:hypothetical protein